MPYVSQQAKAAIKSMVRGPETPGELNWFLTTTILDYLAGVRSYNVYNEVIGALECVKQELYRRLVSDYEDEQRVEHGDVYYEERAADVEGPDI